MLVVVIYGLATWRIASLFVNESGPWDIFLRIRERAGIEHDDEKIKTIIPDRFGANLLACVWCCSLWVGIFWMAMDWLLADTSLRLAAAFAFSTVAILIQKALEK
jgi:uncharacterized protein DUF1360